MTDLPFVPSHRGLALCGEYLPEPLKSFLYSGTHQLNPYHNAKHMMQVVYWSHACLDDAIGAGMKISTRGHDVLRRVLTVAAAFHDHDHTGGRQPDTVNIAKACHFLTNVYAQCLNVWDNTELNVITGLIKCTMFHDGRFNGFTEVDPDFAHLALCLRDADLMAIYTDEGRQLIKGLAEEMGRPFTKEFVQGNHEFLKAQTMYTGLGQYYQEHHLADAVAELAKLATPKILGHVIVDKAELSVYTDVDGK